MNMMRGLILAGWALLAFVAVSLIANPAEFTRVVKPFFTHFIMLSLIALMAAYGVIRFYRRAMRRSAAASSGRTRRNNKGGKWRGR